MAKIAKIALSADIKDFRSKMEETKKLLNDMGEMKINPTISDDFKKKFEEDLIKSAENLESKIGDIELALKKAGEKGVSAYDSKDVQDLVKTQEEYNQKLKDTKRALEDITNEKKKAPPEDNEGGGGGKPPSMLRRAGGMVGSNMGRAASGMGFTLGVGALVGRARSLAQQDIGIRQLTGGNTIGDEKSELGFTRAERQSRASGLAQAAGRDMGSDELGGLVNFGEKIERAFGIGAGEQATTMSAARKAGVKDEQKFMGDAIGDALQTGLEGSSISEYLASMTSYMESMSKGIDVNEGSLRGFSGALASMDFFKKDPGRIFDTINNLNQMFSGGDRFQQAQSAMAINQVAGGGASPSGIEVRRKMGLFGELDPELLKSAGFNEQQRKTLGTGGSDILKQTFGNVMKQTEGLDKSAQFEAFLNATNLDPGAGLPIFDKLVNKKDIGEMDMKALEDANKTPEEKMADRINATMDNHSGKMLEATAIIDEAVNKLAEELGTSVSELIVKLDDLGVSFEAVAKVMMAGMALNAIGGGKGGMLGKLGGMLGGKGKGVSKIGGMVGKAMPMVGKAARFAGPLAAAYSVFQSDDLGPKEGSLERKLEDGTITPEERKQLYEQSHFNKKSKDINSKMKTSPIIKGVSAPISDDKSPTFSGDKEDTDLTRSDSTSQIVQAIEGLGRSNRNSPRDGVRTSKPSSTMRQR